MTMLGRMFNGKSPLAKPDLLLDALLGHHCEMVAITDDTGVIVSESAVFSEAMRLGGCKKQGDSVLDLIERGKEHGYKEILKYLHREKKPLVKHRWRCRLGESNRDLYLTVIPVLDSRDHIIYLLHILQPADANSKQPMDLGHLEKLTNMGQIAAGMAHELNTPLGAIILSADHISELSTKPAVVDEADKIRARAEHCSRVVNELLGYARSDDNNRQLINIDSILRKVENLVEAEARKRNIDLVIEAKPHQLQVRCVENQMEQVFFNLLSNSFHAIGDNGTVTIKSTRDELMNQIVIRVSDTGGGIPPQNLEKVFQPFFTTKPGSQGTGLGLALCRKIIIEHGGRIDSYSGNGQGATFEIRLPTA